MKIRKKRMLVWMLHIVAMSSLLSIVSALPEIIKIGGLFETSEEQQQLAFRYAIDTINSDISILPRSRLQPDITIIAPHDSFRALKSACDFLEGGVAALFGPSSPSTAGTLQSACDNLTVPYLQTHWDYTSSLRTHSLNFFPETKTLASSYLDVIIYLKWKSFTLIYEDNEALIRLQDIVKIPTVQNIKVKLRHVEADHDFKKLMKDLWKQREFNFVVDLPLEKTHRLFHEANEVRMMTEYQNYLLTSLDIHTIDWNPDVVRKSNITALRLVDPENSYVNRIVKDWIFSEKRQGRRISSKQPIVTETALLYDAVVSLALTLHELDASKPIVLKSLYCQNSNQWHRGSSIINHMKTIQRDGMSGEIKFDKNGQRTNLLIDVVKIDTQGALVKFAQWSSESGIEELKTAADVEAGYSKLLENTTLRVTTIISEPYITRKEGDFKGNDRYQGFCIDVVAELAKELKFKFIIDVLPTKTYGNNKTGEWDGMIGKLLKREADIAIADLTITSKRDDVVDFTLPFMNLGISILFKKSGKEDVALFSFLQPLSIDVWFCMATAFLGVSLFMYICARLSPYEWVNPHPCEIENEIVENQFTLLNSFWFVIGSIMQQGSDILPRAISTRIIASSWWFFTLIMISSYTANLAAFLTAQRMTAPIENANDLAKQTKIHYGSVEGGSTMGFFKESSYPIYQRMWSFMESTRPSVFTKSNEEGIDRVRRGDYAFLMESTTIEYIVERNCDLTKIGGELDTKGYGIATVPDSPWRVILSTGILKLQENNVFYHLKNKWWKPVAGSATCVDDSGPPSNEMGVRNVAGVYVVVTIGVGIGFIMVIFEFVWTVKKEIDRDSVIVMLWRELKLIFSGRGSTRDAPKEESEGASLEKLPMVNLRTNPNSGPDSDLFS